MSACLDSLNGPGRIWVHAELAAVMSPLRFLWNPQASDCRASADFGRLIGSGSQVLVLAEPNRREKGWETFVWGTVVRVKEMVRNESWLGLTIWVRWKDLVQFAGRYQCRQDFFNHSFFLQISPSGQAMKPSKSAPEIKCILKKSKNYAINLALEGPGPRTQHKELHPRVGPQISSQERIALVT